MTGFGEGGPAWDDTPADPGADGSDYVPSSANLGDGHTMRLNEETFRWLMHHPATLAGLEARGKLIEASANSLVAMDPRAVARLGEGKPAYVARTNDDMNNKRARVYVETANLLGIINEKHHASLLKAMMAHPSDPIPTYEAAAGGEEE